MSELGQIEFELIEAYLQEHLSAEERTAFESRMENDAALRKEVEMQRENMLAVELGAFSKAIEKIADDYAHEHPAIDPIPATRKGPGKWIGIAAGIAALLAITIWITSDTDPSAGIYAEHFVADPGLPVTMGMTDDPVFTDAMVDYKAEKYEKAIAKWSALESASTNDTLRYYIASAHLANEDPAQAIPIFSDLSKEGNSAFEHKAQWYLIMSYLHAGQKEKALAVQVSADSPYAEKAAGIKQRLKQ